MPTVFSKAHWIGVPKSESTPGSEQMRSAFFRLQFKLAAPTDLSISISAHSRYRLWVNGMPVTYGPCKGDRWRHFFETVDIGPYLQVGENVLAVRVISFIPYESQHDQQRAPYWTMARAVGPCLIVSGQSAGLACQSTGQNGIDVTTGVAAWEAMEDAAQSWKHFMLSHWMGAMESVQGSRLPHGWIEAKSSPADAWLPAASLWRAEDKMLSTFGIIPVFPLTPRPIPLAMEQPARFSREMPLRSEDVAPIVFGSHDHAVVPPNSTMAVELDAGELTTGFIQLKLQGGTGSRVCLRYAEGYSVAEGRHARKGVRDDWQNYTINGHEDEYFPGGESECYIPFWFRTFRFVRVEIQTADEALTLFKPDYTETGYPLEVLSDVQASESWIKELWDMSVRTLRRCMHETYEDCPYYEQLQYIQDSRLEMLFTYAVSGDPRMARRTLEDFHSSKLPDGMLQARYPTQEPLVIPPFSLHWIFMVLEYYRQTGDKEVIRLYRSTVDAVLEWYAGKVGPLGLVEKMGYWEQIDWVDQWSHIAGCTPASSVGPATTHNLMYACALQAGAELNEIIARPGLADEYRQRATDILKAVDTLCWSEENGLYREGPEYEEYSQHAQVYAVLTNLKQGTAARSLLEKALDREGIALCSFTQQYFLFRALEMCDAYDLTERQWPLWRNLMDKHLTTVPETPDGKSSPRSDCHAWSALPLFEFTHTLLGVNPTDYGWNGITVKPYVRSLQSCAGTVITPHGPVQVAWRHDQGRLHLDIDAPAGEALTVIWPDGSRESHPAGGPVKGSRPYTA